MGAEPPDEAVCWSTREMAARPGVGKHFEAKVWRERELPLWLADVLKASADPDFKATLPDMIGPCADPPELAVVFSFDATPGPGLTISDSARVRSTATGMLLNRPYMHLRFWGVPAYATGNLTGLLHAQTRGATLPGYAKRKRKAPDCGASDTPCTLCASMDETSDQPEAQGLPSLRLRPAEFEAPPDDPFKHDRLNRRPQIEGLTQTVLGIEGPCVIALDAQWGEGKTAFVRMWAQSLRNEGCTVYELNAWENDDIDEPLVALYREVLRTSDDKGKESTASGGRRRLTDVLRHAIVGIRLFGMEFAFGAGRPQSSGYTPPESQDAWKEIENVSKSQIEARDTFKKELQEYVEDNRKSEQNEPIVICVDELDRCRPDYSVRFLETIKHLFEIDGLVFILAVNLHELGHSVSGIYGHQFDGRNYLKRFIDWTVSPNPLAYREGLFDQWIQSHLHNSVRTEAWGIAEQFLERFMGPASGSSLRDWLQATHYRVALQNALPVEPRDERPRKVQIPELAACFIVLQSVVPEAYRKFIRRECSDRDVRRALFAHNGRFEDWSPPEHSESARVDDLDARFEGVLASWADFLFGRPNDRELESSVIYQYYAEYAVAGAATGQSELADNVDTHRTAHPYLVRQYAESAVNLANGHRNVFEAMHSLSLHPNLEP